MSEIRRFATIAVAALITASQVSAEITRDVIFITGQPAAGFPAGATIQTFNNAWVRPQVNARGHVLLSSFAVGGGVNASNDQGLWLATRAGLVLMLREGDPAPGIPNA